MEFELQFFTEAFVRSWFNHSNDGVVTTSLILLANTALHRLCSPLFTMSLTNESFTFLQSEDLPPLPDAVSVPSPAVSEISLFSSPESASPVPDLGEFADVPLDELHELLANVTESKEQTDQLYASQATLIKEHEEKTREMYNELKKRKARYDCMKAQQRATIAKRTAVNKRNTLLRRAIKHKTPKACKKKRNDADDLIKKYRYTGLHAYCAETCGELADQTLGSKVFNEAKERWQTLTHLERAYYSKKAAERKKEVEEQRMREFEEKVAKFNAARAAAGESILGLE